MSFGADVAIGGLIVFEMLFAEPPGGRHMGVISFGYDGNNVVVLAFGKLRS